MPARLTNSAALVTGASSGIGRPTAAALAGEGATVALVARRRERLDSLAARVGEAGGPVLAVESAIPAGGTAADVVGRTVAELGRLDILINNAGLMLLGRVEGADTSQWRRMLDINVAALMLLSHAALPHVLESAASEPRGVADI